MSSSGNSVVTATAPTSTSKGAHASFGTTDAGLVLLALIWGVNYSVVKQALSVMPALMFNALRMTIAALILGAVSIALRNVARPDRRDIAKLMALGFLGNGIYQVLFIIGMKTTRAGSAALVVAAGPAWIAIISRMMGRERVSSRAWLGIVLQLLGVAIVVVSTKGVDASRDALFGTALIVIGSICWSFYSVLVQPLTARVHPIQLSALMMLAGALFMGVLAAPDLVTLDWGTLGASAWLGIAYASVGALVIGYLLFYRGVRVLGSTRTAMYGNLQPIIALLVAWKMLGEQPTVFQWIGTALVIGGLVISRTAHVAPSPDTVST